MGWNAACLNMTQPLLMQGEQHRQMKGNLPARPPSAAHLTASHQQGCTDLTTGWAAGCSICNICKTLNSQQACNQLVTRAVGDPWQLALDYAFQIHICLSITSCRDSHVLVSCVRWSPPRVSTCRQPWTGYWLLEMSRGLMILSLGQSHQQSADRSYSSSDSCRKGLLGTTSSSSSSSHCPHRCCTARHHRQGGALALWVHLLVAVLLL
jgi:hypothetical protein